MIHFFTKHKVPAAALALILSAVMLTTACPSSATVLTYLEQVTPTVVAILNLVSAFGGPAVDATQTAQITEEVANVIDLYKKFQAASASAQPAALAQFNAAYATMQANLTEILSTIHVADATKQKQIQAAVAAAFLLFNQIEVLIPSNTPTPQQKTAAKAGYLYKSPTDYKTKFNHIMSDAGHAELSLK